MLLKLYFILLCHLYKPFITLMSSSRDFSFQYKIAINCLKKEQHSPYDMEYHYKYKNLEDTRNEPLHMKAITGPIHVYTSIQCLLFIKIFHHTFKKLLFTLMNINYYNFIISFIIICVWIIYYSVFVYNIYIYPWTC